MYSALFGLESAFLLLLLAFAWTAGSKASRLLYFGSAERLARRSRKLLSWTVFASLAAISAATAVCLMSRSYDSAFWTGRAALHLPLIALPALGIWLSSLPSVWRLWRGAKRLNGAHVPAELAKLSASPAMIVPYQAAAIGAGASLYFLFTAPVPWGTTDVAAFVLAYMALASVLWVLHRRKMKRLREQRVAV